MRARVGRVSVVGVSHHAKLSNPRVGAVRGLLKRTCWARAHMWVRVAVRIRVIVTGLTDGWRVESG